MNNKITITDTFDIGQAINEMLNLARQSLYINYHLETLVGQKDSSETTDAEIYSLTFQVSRNLEHMKALSIELDELSLVERKMPEDSKQPAINTPSNSVFRHESFRIIALSKSLAAWLESQPVSENLGELDMDSGDGLELAHMILKSSLSISEAAREAQP